ncbi:MAG TPA: sialidase family protein [Chloroflexota bacterium]|nr:sialidase family protein [Chloroflexota bacterium]
MRSTSVLFATALTVLLAASASASTTGDVNVTSGSPPSPFSQNKQNEPAMAIDANHPNIVVAGSNDQIDEEACNAGNDTSCPFTPGVGVSGFYYSSDSGHSWKQPTYSGWTARGCLGVVGNTDPGCAPAIGPIGTLPGYFESGLVSDGDPALAFGPVPGSNGSFSWANGSRLYYANLTSNFPGKRTFKGFEAIGVSRTDHVAAAASGDQSVWKPPVLVSHQSSTTFSDKEQVWADNASSSPFFGNVYICWASFLGEEISPFAVPAPLLVAVSSDGGSTWTQHLVSPAANNGQRNPMDGCTVRTDSHGNAYVFGVGTSQSAGHQPFEIMTVSHNGGATWSPQTPVAGPVSQPGIIDPVLGRPTIDGIAGARSDLAPGPSVDIANGAPTGADATNRIVMSYVSGEIVQPHVYFTESANQGATWSTPRAIETAGDRGYYTAPAISPDGTNVYVVYNAFTTPYRYNTNQARALVGVFLQASVGTSGTGAFTEIHRGASGDPRASSQNNLVGEFLGDYVYAAATRTYGTAVWNDVRNGADCPAIDVWRMSLRSGSTAPPPAPQQNCDPTFGNSDIYSFTTAH